MSHPGTSGHPGTPRNPGQSPARESAAEPRISLPSRLLFFALTITVLLVAGLWAAVVSLGLWGLGMKDFVSGMLGVGAVGAVALAGTAILSPWKQRPVADWMTMWLAGTVFRLLATPVVVFLLYSALSSSLAVKSLAMAVAITYLATLFVEAIVLARHVKGLSTPRP